MKKNGRFYIANDDRIPLHAQPENGYTWLGVIERAQREIEEAVQLLNVSYDEAKQWFCVLDENFHEVEEARSAF